MRHFGLIGRSLGHSFSQAYFRAKFKAESIDAEYHNLELQDLSNLINELEKRPYSGLNVTIPYKEEIISFLHQVNEVASEISAVNLVELREGQLIGHNTDWQAFKDSIEPLIGSRSNALILGTGGASKAICYAFKQMGIAYKMVSRTRGDLLYTDLNENVLLEHHIIVNCTPMGMGQLEAHAPNLPYQFIGEKHLAYDLIYNPTETLFLKRCLGNGAKIKNGLEMLEKQAELGWKIWNS